MRTIIVVKRSTRGGQSASGSRYISERERNPAREEPHTRPLFNADREGMKAKAADRYLAGGDRAKPASNELHHIIIAFRRHEAEQLEKGAGAGRDRPYHEIIRAAMKGVARHLGVEPLRWVAGVHRHTEHPHVHLLLHKKMKDETMGRFRTLGRLPPSLLNGRDAEGRPTSGEFDRCLSEAIDRVFPTRDEPEYGHARGAEYQREVSTPSGDASRAPLKSGKNRLGEPEFTSADSLLQAQQKGLVKRQLGSPPSDTYTPVNEQRLFPDRPASTSVEPNRSDHFYRTPLSQPGIGVSKASFPQDIGAELALGSRRESANDCPTISPETDIALVSGDAPSRHPGKDGLKPDHVSKKVKSGKASTHSVDTSRLGVLEPMASQREPPPQHSPQTRLDQPSAESASSTQSTNLRSSERCDDDNSFRYRPETYQRDEYRGRSR